jgi:hypothetical protein
MHTPRRVATIVVAVVALSAAAPAVASAQTPAVPTLTPNSQACYPYMMDLGPLGPLGPYGPMGPWGALGPLAGQPNPLGNVATCGGMWALIGRSLPFPSFGQGSAAPH